MSRDAAQAGDRVANAEVALAYWAGYVRDFNDEVARIVEAATSAGTCPAVAHLGADEIVVIRSEARRDGEIRMQVVFGG